MRLKLKEDPKEWVKFTALLVVVLAALTLLLWRRTVIDLSGLRLILLLLALVFASALVRPRWFRPLYRGAMTVSFAIGQVMGRVLLALIFVLLLVPLGVLLRLFGKDLLCIRRRPDAESYWRPAKVTNDFDRMF